jgi:hypothetical protein
MIHSTSPLCICRWARLAVLLPCVSLGSACSGSDAANPAAGVTTSSGDGGTGGGGVSGGKAGSSGVPSGQEASGGGSAGSSAGRAGSSAADDPGGDDAGRVDTGRVDTAAPSGPAAVRLGAAGNYAVLAASAISNVPTSIITGALGLSPAAASYITGFTLTRAGTMWTSPEVSGGVFGADNDPPTPADLTTAVADMGTAYDDAAGRVAPQFVNLGDGAIGGLTLAPGLYMWTSSVTIPSNVTLAGAPDDVWIFQIAGDLTLDADQRVTLSGGAQAKNVVWQVAGAVDVGVAAHAEGILLSKTAIHTGTGASINGRLLAQTAVTLQGTTVTEPAH